MNGPWRVEFRGDSPEWKTPAVVETEFADFPAASEVLRRWSSAMPVLDWRIVDANGVRVLAVTNGTAQGSVTT